MIYDLAFTLHNAIESHPDVILLKELETKIKNDAQVLALAKKCEALQLNLNELLEYLDVENVKVKEVRHELSARKFELDTNPFVSEYNAQYKKVSKIYDHVSQVLFEDFCNQRGCRCQ